jgi:hypothetical protein
VIHINHELRQIKTCCLTSKSFQPAEFNPFRHASLCQTTSRYIALRGRYTNRKMHIKNFFLFVILALISVSSAFVCSNTKIPILGCRGLNNAAAHKASRRPKGLGIRSLVASSSFDTWLENNGARSACTVTDANRKLIAKQDLKAGAEACSIPIKLCMNEKTAKEALGQRADEVNEL